MKASFTAVIMFSFVGVIGFAFYHHVMMLEYDMQHIIPNAHNLTYKSYDVQYCNYLPGIVSVQHTFSDGKTRDA